MSFKALVLVTLSALFPSPSSGITCKRVCNRFRERCDHSFRPPKCVPYRLPDTVVQKGSNRFSLSTSGGNRGNKNKFSLGTANNSPSR